MLVNKSNLSQIFINLRTSYNKAFDAAPTTWEKTTTKIISGGSQNDYGWLSRFPKMREWIGDKVLKALAAHKYNHRQQGLRGHGGGQTQRHRRRQFGHLCADGSGRRFFRQAMARRAGRGFEKTMPSPASATTGSTCMTPIIRSAKATA